MSGYGVDLTWYNGTEIISVMHFASGMGI